MAAPLYELTFYGRLVDGIALETAKNNVMTLFKASPAQVDKMFAGGRVVIRNKLDQATASKYIAIMRKNGLVCETEPMGESGDVASPSTSSAPSNTGATPSSTAAAAASSVAPQAPASVAATQDSAPPAKMEVASKSGLNIAGEKVDDILQQSHLGLDPVGIRLSEHEDVEAPEFAGLDDITIAPVGVALADEKEAPPVIVPDTSGISIAPVGTNLADSDK